MASIESTQKAKLTLRALDLAFSKEVKTDYYVQPKLQKSLDMNDLANEVAALSTRQEDPTEIARIGNQLMERMAWFLSSGYSISTALGYFRPTASGVFHENELNSALDRTRLKLGVSYSMSKTMREALDGAEIDVEIQKAVTGPQLYAVVSAQDAQNPSAAAQGEGTPIKGGQTCIIKGKKIKVGGTGDQIGVTITRQDGDTQTTYFFPPTLLYPNTASQVGFVMPADAPDGSLWSLTLCTQIGSSGTSQLLKEARTATLADYFVVGEVTTDNEEDSDIPDEL